MAKIEEDEDRENRIHMEIVVDAYDEKERRMGWYYYYLEEQIDFPFLARCVARRAVSPLKVGDEVEVIGMAPDEECMNEIFVMMRWERDGLAVPLSQLKGGEKLRLRHIKQENHLNLERKFNHLHAVLAPMRAHQVPCK